DSTNKAGISINEIADSVYQRLITSGQAGVENISVNDSENMHVYNSYIPIKCKTTLVEEIMELISQGLLIQIKFKRLNPMNYDFSFDLTSDQVILTEYGLQFLKDTHVLPYFADQYLDLLRRIAEPDRDLQNYLSEGIACLRHHLSRASAILLRAAIEHTLAKLIESTRRAIQDSAEQSMFDQNIRRARNNIEDRAEAVFRKLESTAGLIPDSDYFRGIVRNRLRAAFHSIRDLGGKAVHTAEPIEQREVLDHYTLFSSSVYPPVMTIIAHHDQITSISP